MFMDHIVLNADDEYLLMDFYMEIIGLEPDRLDLYRRDEVPFPSVRINADTIIDIFPKKMWAEGGDQAKGTPNLNHFCMGFSRDEWEALRGRLDTAGVEIFRGPENVWGAHGQGISIFFRDPEDNIVEAKTYDAG
jgi:catechol 2,3-dioxygenase-like lactoylglutathione lyase family enzyme